MSRGVVVVSVDELVVVAAEIPATVRAELGRLFAATLLMLLQLIGTAESADIAYLDLLTGLGCGVEREAWLEHSSGFV